MRGVSPVSSSQVCSPSVPYHDPCWSSAGPGLASGGGPIPHGSAGAGRSSRAVWISGVVPCLTLALLVTQVLADHHDHAVAADHLALVADPLDARLYLHVISQLCSRCATCSGRRSGLGTDRRAKAPRPPGPRAGCGYSADASCR